MFEVDLLVVELVDGGGHVTGLLGAGVNVAVVLWDEIYVVEDDALVVVS